MTSESNSLVIRDAVDSDIDSIVGLFTEDGSNPYGWCADKWRHYYRNYPEGKPTALVAELNGVVVGHYGMLPIKIGELPAMLGMHAYVFSEYRGLTIISALMKEVDKRCRAQGVAMICGFANSKFSLIKKTFFKWKTLFWLGFKSGLTADDVRCEPAPFFFNYSPKWFAWRFGEVRNTFISRYTDARGNIKKQLLKINRGMEAPTPAELLDSEGWSPALVFLKEQQDQFCQPFSLKIYDTSLLDAGVLRPENWFIEMGDSDTFQYLPWSNTP